MYTFFNRKRSESDWQEAVLHKSDRARASMKNSKETSTIRGDDQWRWFWDIGIAFITLWYALSVPRVWIKGMDDVMSYGLRLGLEVTWTLVLCADIAVNFKTGYLDSNSRLITNTLSKCEYYGKRWLIVDVLAALPLDLITPRTSLGFRIVSHFRLLKLPKIFRLWRPTHRPLLSRQYVWFIFVVAPLIKIFLYSVVTLHWLTVIWMRISEGAPRSTNRNNYIESIYVVAYSLATVGYGEVLVITNAQKLYLCVIFGLSFAVNGFFVSYLASSAQRYNVKKEFSLKMLEMMQVMVHYGVPTELQSEVCAYLLHQLRHDMIASYAPVIGSLPIAMRKRLALCVKMRFISQVPLFKDCSIEARVALAQQLGSVIVEPEEIIIREGEEGREMYFINHGYVEIYSQAGAHIRTLGCGDFFGEVALLLDAKRTAYIKALTYCELLKLDKEVFTKIVDGHADLKQKVQEEIERRGISVSQLSPIRKVSSVIEVKETKRAEGEQPNARRPASKDSEELSPITAGESPAWSRPSSANQILESMEGMETALSDLASLVNAIDVATSSRIDHLETLVLRALDA